MSENSRGSPKPRYQIKNGEVVGASYSADTSIEKVSNTDLPVSRLRLGEIGYSGLRNIQDYVDQELVRALRWPCSLETYDKMYYDHDVRLGLYLSQIFVEKAFKQPEIKFNKDSSISKEAAEFVKWNLDNMANSFQESIRDAYTFKRYGFSLLVKNYEAITSGKYQGKYPYKIKKLSPRSQKTLNKTDPFVMKDGEVFAARQDTRSLSNTFGLFKPDTDEFKGKATIEIPRNKFMLFSYDSINGNPLGSSPLSAAYRAYKEKVLIADYETVGVSKDMGKIVLPLCMVTCTEKRI